MPRLTNQQYLDNYKYLREAWLESNYLYSVLPTHEQRILFRYYQAHRQLGDLELITHRKTVTAESPSLPARAGKVLGKMRSQTRSGQVASATGGGRRIVVYPLARPEVDYYRLAQALMTWERTKKG